MIVTNLQEWKDFKEGKFWGFMQEEFRGWLHDIHSELEDVDMKNTEKITNRLAGNAQTIRRVLDFVDITIEENEDAREHPELDNEEGSRKINDDWENRDDQLP